MFKTNFATFALPTNDKGCRKKEKNKSGRGGTGRRARLRI